MLPQIAERGRLGRSNIKMCISLTNLRSVLAQPTTPYFPPFGFGQHTREEALPNLLKLRPLQLVFRLQTGTQKLCAKIFAALNAPALYSRRSPDVLNIFSIAPRQTFVVRNQTCFNHS